jgi:hypothetical protein
MATGKDHEQALRAVWDAPFPSCRLRRFSRNKPLISATDKQTFPIYWTHRDKRFYVAHIATESTVD